MSRWHPSDGDEAVAEKAARTKTRRRLRRPKLYKVLLHNDDYTTMDFVVFVLMTVFYHSEEEAVRIMLNVHHRGVGVAGIYPREVAETRVSRVEALARQHEFPLRCSIEEA
jgi:ATP-dependent Clp protease adaptor protein ClpS